MMFVDPLRKLTAVRATPMLLQLFMGNARARKPLTPTDEALLNELRLLVARRGKLTTSLIEA